jgi:hypothetical protein
MLLKVTGSDQPFSRQEQVEGPDKPQLPTGRTMRTAPDFVVALARVAKKSHREIKLLVENACGNKKMSYSQINSLFKAVKDEKITKMTKRIADVVAIAATI